MQAKLDAVKVQIEDNRVHKEKLMAVIANCQKLKQLPPVRITMGFILENLKENLKEVKEEMKLADSFLKRSTNKTVVLHIDEVWF